MGFDKLYRYIMARREWAQLTQVFPPIKPSAICIGAQKGGTTALFDYFTNHPGVLRSRIKEINFFNCDANFSRGISFYHSFFPRKTLASHNKLTFDITPGYIVDAERTAKRIFDYNPDMRIIVLLRNPITRAYSAWQMYRKLCSGNREWFYKWMERCDPSVHQDFFIRRPSSFGQNFEKDITDEIDEINRGQIIEMPILRLGIYHQYLKYYFEYFPQDQIFITSSEDMKKDTKGELLKIEKFVGLEPHTWSQEELRPSFEGKYSDGMSQSEYMLLKSFYKEHNETLFDLLQTEYAWN